MRPCHGAVRVAGTSPACSRVDRRRIAPTAAACCSGSCDFFVNDGSCTPCHGRSGSTEHPRCGGLDCANGFCDGCRDGATSCTDDTQCCFSDCTNGACLSTLGAPCVRDADCRVRSLDRACTNACVNGSCTA